MATIQIERNIQKGSFTTLRNDKWWLVPLIEDIVIIAFIIYTLAVMLTATSGMIYSKYGYVSPIYGINIIPHSFYTSLGWSATLSTAWIFIWAPLGFRASCYAERKIYYRGFFATPPACQVNGVDVRRGKYTGERSFPFILNNFHRYFAYATFVLMVLQTLDVLVALTYGIGIGTILMIITAVFLSLYVYGCHALRHAAGGGRNCYTCSPIAKTQYKIWSIGSKLNQHHERWFWCSLVMVMVVDIWIHLVVGNPSIDMFIKFPFH